MTIIRITMRKIRMYHRALSAVCQNEAFSVCPGGGVGMAVGQTCTGVGEPGAASAGVVEAAGEMNRAVGVAVAKLAVGGMG